MAIVQPACMWRSLSLPVIGIFRDIKATSDPAERGKGKQSPGCLEIITILLIINKWVQVPEHTRTKQNMSI